MLNTRQGRPKQKCPGCNEELSCRYREFSPQTWSLLIHWQEVDESAVDQPMCAECYRDLREVLIERADQMQGAFQQPERQPVVKKSREIEERVRKAS